MGQGSSALTPSVGLLKGPQAFNIQDVEFWDKFWPTTSALPMSQVRQRPPVLRLAARPNDNGRTLGGAQDHRGRHPRGETGMPAQFGHLGPAGTPATTSACTAIRPHRYPTQPPCPRASVRPPPTRSLQAVLQLMAATRTGMATPESSAMGQASALRRAASPPPCRSPSHLHPDCGMQC